MLNAGEKYVFLVEEQYRRRRREARVIANGVEQRQTVMHCVLDSGTKQFIIYLFI